jgi:hypothetical protein
MRLSNWKVPPTKISADTSEPERVDRVVVAVVGLFLVFVLIRGVIPALMHGEQVGMALLAAGLGFVALAIALLPAWKDRRGPIARWLRSSRRPRVGTR